MSKPDEFIPKGCYCYTRLEYNKIKVCPYWSWSINPSKNIQNNGHCSYLDEGDWESPGRSLLWDQVKECGINMELDEDD